MTKFVAILIVVGLLIAVYSSALLRTTKPAAITIPSGATAKHIGRLLKEQGAIASEFMFNVYVRLAGVAVDFRAGTFTIPPKASVRDIVAILTGRAASGDVRVTIVEGWDLAEIATALEPVGVSADDFYALAGKPPYLRRDRAYQKTLEGYLFPDTYFFRRNSSAEEVIKRLQDNLKRRVGDVPNLHETLTIASLLQAEVRSDDDMRRVADIIRRRLDAGWGLQIDATVNYITGKNSPSASSEDLKIDSPYNTYKYRGLPPGPINNPGLQAIRAAGNPWPNDAWYYLTGKDGTVHYARTLDEHRANRKYL